jgi:vacuolar-type H+-ATPase subunit H
MDDVLQELLDVEFEAEALVTDARSKHDKVIERAREEARAVEERFEAHRQDLRASFMQKAEERAAQAMSESQRRHGEQLHKLQLQTAQHERDAIDAALALFLDAAGD